MTNVQLSPGTELGRYELLQPIAKGGMAQVWAARLIGTRGFTKLVAIKTILQGTMDDTRLEQMFMAEASLAAQIHHPNVVETLELGEHEGTLYLAMEWVEGEALHYVLSRAQEQGGMPLHFAVNLIGQACKGLHAAHELRGDGGELLLGVVHRDVSPQNILVGYGGMAKLVDFGIAKATARNSGLTEEGELKGKVSFMAPEQLKGQALDRRTDLFALGIVLFELSTGRHPFKGANPAETIRRICTDEPPPWLTTKASDYPPELRRVVERALARDPMRRWGSAEEMLAGLQQALPQAFEAGVESKLKLYLDGLLGQRARERRGALRLAQETVDRAKAQSCGSLRALTLDSAADIHELSSGSMVSLPDSSSQRSARRMSPAPLPPLPPLQNTRPLLLTAGVAGVFGLGVLLALRSPAPAPAASPVVAASPAPIVVVAPPTASATAPPTATATVSAAPSASVEHLSTEKARRRAWAPPPTSGKKSLETPASTASERAPPANPSGGNAWDPQSFGSRH
ncbi:MAG TPA: serine/threonine-protein kinase [Polyangiaceae bacterium]|nr:serine/threonine-protein kinase [Polyangiaceae bacterium]